MLEGITVLNQEAAIDFEVGPFFVSLIIIVVLGALLSAWLDSEFVFIAILFLGGLFISLPVSCNESEDRLRYECLIDESVSMTEVYERYEVIEQRGDIWVLEDKE